MSLPGYRLRVVVVVGQSRRVAITAIDVVVVVVVVFLVVDGVNVGCGCAIEDGHPSCRREGGGWGG
jgi:hypothetical protein